MSRKAILKLAGYVVERYMMREDEWWGWTYAIDEQNVWRFNHKTEDLAWRAAWKHLTKKIQQNNL